ncbi:Spy/CpxP family protein refolding chaperone [Kitasatospora sp. MAP12-15]|uniref:hypothetical protein n=1 Tax=unclassified Kitasatospora TaxID=2633591 RepID=UPI002474AA44|nr:hypothetical protein [Kitasatospora sp. MAP12-44]MDH6108784.1 Spy/CpxP family protein refolding chaperone [Kitasatospora sp. MAP12-44]
MRAPTRIVRLCFAGALLGAAAVLAAAATAAAVGTNPSAYPAPSHQEHTYSIPVGAVTDLGDLTKIANLGSDVAGFLGH